MGLIIDYLLRFVEAILVIRVVISWVPQMANNQFVDLLYKFTEPILKPCRSILSKTPLGKNMMFDVSPIFAFVAIEIIRTIIRVIFKAI